jgi:hypothetical protein
MSGFGTEYAMLRATRPIADLICHYIEKGTAEDLERAILDGWSLVAQVKKEPREKLLAVVDEILSKPSYFDIKTIVETLRTNPPTDSQVEGSSFLKNLDASKIISHVVRKLPSHGGVLIRHPGWVEAEISRVQELLR